MAKVSKRMRRTIMAITLALIYSAPFLLSLHPLEGTFVFGGKFLASLVLDFPRHDLIIF
jgi:hypothetical protein